MNAGFPGQQGFWIAGLCLLIVTISNGMINSGLAVYDEVLIEHFGTSIAPLKLRDSITFLGSSGFVLVAGLWVDRKGTKTLLMAGLAMLSVVYFIYPLTSSLTEVYALHLVCALVLACAGNMTAIVTAAHALPDRTGLAIGMAVAGTSVGGMLIPPIAAQLIGGYGWETAMRLQAGLPLLAMALVLWALPRNAGSQSKRGSGSGSGSGSAPVERAKDVFRSGSFYSVTLAASLTYYGALSLFSHLFLYLRSLEIELSSAALGMSVLAGCALAGKLLIGHLSDRLPFDAFFRFQMIVMLAGIIALTVGGSGLWAGIAVAGFGWGGLHALYNIVLVRLFGLAVAGRVNSTVSVAEAIGGATGIAVTGWLADLGGYPLAFSVAAGCCAMAVILIFATPSRLPALRSAQA